MGATTKQEIRVKLTERFRAHLGREGHCLAGIELQVRLSPRYTGTLYSGDDLSWVRSPILHE